MSSFSTLCSDEKDELAEEEEEEVVVGLVVGGWKDEVASIVSRAIRCRIGIYFSLTSLSGCTAIGCLLFVR